MRFAIWTAVSTLEQVEGASLDHQLNKCREHGLAEGWQDTGLVFIAEGYSRTGYVNLFDAERDIPPLADCLNALRSNQYDVLACFNYDRFGDLILMVANEFRNHKKQLYSVSQPTPVVENYDPDMDDSSYVMQAFAPIWDKMRKSDIRRKWRAGMPKRIRDGLTPLTIPFGYRWKGKKEIPDPVPAELDLVMQMGEWLMQGISLREIKRRCEASGILSPRGLREWDPTTIRGILANPHYAGQVALHKTKVIPAPDRKRKKKQIPQPREKWNIQPGKHQAIWTLEEHRAILRELDRRRELNIHNTFRYPLSGLMYCGVCGRKLYRGSHRNASRGRSQLFPMLSCNKHGSSHIIWECDSALPVIAQEIESACRDYPFDSPPPPASTVDSAAALDDLIARRKRVQQSAERGVYTPEEAAERVNELERQIESAKRRAEEKQNQLETRRIIHEQLSQMVDHMAEWIQTDDPAAVHQLLASIIERIVVHPDHRMEIQFR